MSKKQIIIDGVDVKDCKRRIGKDNYCRYYKRPCSENNFNCIWKKYLRKEQECEELKKRLESFQKDYSKLYQVVENKGYIKELDQLKQTLTEIKEIAEPFCNACQEFEPEKSKNCINCTYCNYNKILQKISEVLKDE